ncbi:zinc transporter ZIP1-like [Anopheles aquasalis]|uniref:zinc transporter ZIP1-like n=1 Tax=Anopheles aquasalis TaxID=42839 RepID=UPI00215A2B27|nr:zinc transporter ZIP1-like [Anopheles aquasalis]
MQILPTDSLLTMVLEEGANATQQAAGLSALRPRQTGDDDTPTIAKVTSMVVLFSVSMVCGLVPFKLVQWFNINPQSPSGGTHLFLIRLLLSFGGGALLSTTFLHLLPEINHSIAALQETGALPQPEELPFPLGEFLLTSGFFMIYLLEEVVHWWMHRRSARAHHRSTKAGATSTTNSKAHLHTHDTMMAESKQSHAHGHSHLPVGNVTAVYPITDVDGTQIVPEAVAGEADSTVAPVSSSSLRGLLIVLALSIHELFEGLAVGLERSPSAVWILFGAVASHKFVIAFCVAFELLVAAVRFRVAIAYIFVYSVVSPLGIAIGIALSSVGNDANQTIEVVSVILQGLASGTLLYVIFFEILAKDSGHSHGGGEKAEQQQEDHGGHNQPSTNGLWQFFAVLVGFGLLFGIMVATGHSHEHGHSHGGSDEHDHDHDHEHDDH